MLSIFTNKSKTLKRNQWQWQKSGDVFAQRFEAADIRKYLRDGLNLLPGQGGFALSGGEVTFSENFKVFMKMLVETGTTPSLVLFDAGNVPLEFAFQNLRAGDQLQVDVRCTVVLRFNRDKAGKFVGSMMSPRPDVADAACVAYDDLRNALEREACAVTRIFCGTKDIVKLAEGRGTREELEKAFEQTRGLQGRLDALGLDFVHLGTVEFQGDAIATFRAQNEDLEQRRRNLDFQVRANKLLLGEMTDRDDVENHLLQLAHESKVKEYVRDREVQKLHGEKKTSLGMEVEDAKKGVQPPKPGRGQTITRKTIILFGLVCGIICVRAFLVSRCSPVPSIQQTIIITEANTITNAYLIPAIADPVTGQSPVPKPVLNKEVQASNGGTPTLLELAEQGDAIAQYTLGNTHYQKRDYAKAVRWYAQAAEQGHASAQCNLGLMYYYGKGVRQDVAKATEWFAKAAEQGVAEAQRYVGVMYYDAKDDTQAAEWFAKAAWQGLATAQFNLGVMYYFGKGVPQDYAKALEWYKKAAEQGYVVAQYNLGVMYGNGDGLPRDDTQAAGWYRVAAGQGYADAQHKLGECYEYGRGVKKDVAKAKEWYMKASAQVHHKAGEGLNRLK